LAAVRKRCQELVFDAPFAAIEPAANVSPVRRSELYHPGMSKREAGGVPTSALDLKFFQILFLQFLLNPIALKKTRAH
tara:strand:+ start:538 stop:771 length:234 start_codon:yes stop_codon:yes gene_type:complete